MARKPSHLGRTLRQARKAGRISDHSPIIRLESRELNDDEKARIAKTQKEQQERLARIAARAKGKTS